MQEGSKCTCTPGPHPPTHPRVHYATQSQHWGVGGGVNPPKLRFGAPMHTARRASRLPGEGQQEAAAAGYETGHALSTADAAYTRRTTAAGKATSHKQGCGTSNVVAIQPRRLRRCTPLARATACCHCVWHANAAGYLSGHWNPRTTRSAGSGY
jgi:hypothetical protein